MKTHRGLIPALLATLVVLLGCLHPALAWQPDNGNGTYTNPPLYADYPDPDIIRVGSDFYLVSSTFANSPGINVLHSQDLVNWEIASHVASTLDGGDAFNLVNGAAYRGGMWAPSIRYRNGTFYVVVNPTYANARVYYTTNLAGSWQYYQLDRPAYDPGFFIDDDGTGYIICGGGNQTLLKLNSTYSQVVSQTDNVLASGAEGSHMIKRGGYYYVFNAKPSVWPFQLLCSRATNIYGPYETIVNLTESQGGHQGAIVDMADGTWQGFIMRDSGAVGRMTYISPVYWDNNWPVWGTPAAPNQVPATATKPVAGKPLMQPATSDDFSSSTLGLQWLWNHNPDNTRWSLTERSGYLRLKPTQAAGFWTARNTLTQKGQGPQSRGVVKLDLSHLQAGDICGFGTLGMHNGHIYVTTDGSGNRFLNMEVVTNLDATLVPDTRVTSVPFSGTTLYLRTDLDFQTNRAVCSYSGDGTTWTQLGGQYALEWGWGGSGTFQGDQFAMFCYNPNTASSSGYVDVDSFTFTGSAEFLGAQRGRPKLNPAGSTFVADNGHLLRGPFASTEWGPAPSSGQIEAVKYLGANAIHLYGECFDINYPATGSTAPGYAVDRIDQMVQMTRDAGLYLILTIGNGANNGANNAQYAHDFWAFYAARYKNETHVIYEVHNEPYAWGAPYSQATLNMEVDAYNTIRAAAPDTPVLLFTFAVLGGGAEAVADIQTVSTAANVDWTKTAVGFHGYAGSATTTKSLQTIRAAGYPCFMTEFTGMPWGNGSLWSQDVELTANLERLGISWLTFLPLGQEFLETARYQTPVDRAGISWVPDFGSWPKLRGVHGNGGVPRATPGFTGNTLVGTLRLEAEEFDTGGQDVGYHDADNGTQWGGQYRAEGVDIEATADTGGGYDIGWTNNGEWLEYTVLVTEAGDYNLGLRVASVTTSTMQVSARGVDVSGSIAVPNTGGWQTWSTVNKTVRLSAGQQVIRVSFTGAGFNLNWIEFTPSSTGAIADGTYKFLNRATGKALEGNTSVGVVQNAYTGTTSQQWTLQHLGGGEYKITAASNGWSWNGGGSLNGDAVGFTWWWAADANWQRYLVTPGADGYFTIAPAGSGVPVGIPGGSTADGVQARLHDDFTSPNQQWAVLAPAATAIPANVNATQVSSTQVSLTWSAAPGATSYNVKRSTTSGGPYTTLATGVTTTGYTDTTVSSGTTYYYVVTAVGAGGESLPSMEASAARLIARLKFDETSSTTAADATGNGWNGTLVNGPIWTTGTIGNAVNLDGSNDHVTLPAGIASGVTDFSAAAWIYLNGSSGWMRLLDFGTGTTNYMYLSPTGPNNRPRFAITTGTGEQVIEGNAAIPTGTWTHVAVTLKNGKGSLYINGEEAGNNGAITLTPAMLGTTTLNYVGRSQYSDPYLNARVDDFRFYGNALTPADVRHLTEHPPLPDAPASVGTTAGNAQVVLTWPAVTGATGYTVQRATTSGGPFTVIASAVPRTTFTDTAVTEGVVYYYTVAAENSTGTGSPSLVAAGSCLLQPRPLWLKFDEGSGTTAADTFGSLWNGTLVNGAAWSAGRSGNAVNLDGSDDHVTLPNGVVGGLTDFTISVWVKPDTLATWSRVFDFGTGTNNYLFLTAATPGGVPRFAIRTPSTGEQILDGAAALSTSAWTHLAITRSGNTGTLYVNGVAVATNTGMTLSPSSLGNTTANYLGRSQWADPYFDGAIDEFRVYPRAFSATEVLETTQGLRARLAFDETSGTTASDTTGNGWNGTLVNGPAWIAGNSGNAVNLDGSDDHVTLPAGVVNGLGDFTLAAWVKLDTGSTWARVFDIGTGTNNYLFLTPNGPAGAPRFAIRTPSTGEQIIDGNAAIATGTWTHLAVTRSGNTGTLYVNGTAVGTNTAMTLSPSSLGNTTANYLGKSQWPDPYLDGALDEFRIYGTALSASAVSVLSGHGPQAALAALPPVAISARELLAPGLALASSQAGVTMKDSAPAHHYQLQYSGDLAVWLDYGSPVAGTGGDLTLTMPVDPEAPQRFYRIRVIP
ncbi:LamG-like jellyroll fold domain-containing protein [Luteolibacter sp. LG18]|uniref:LamG-like jellyroll fold domain-containing protein n=1 Tax=Luteolibacter sp. LG18 TaxID=2819286 RepID=UPI002B29460B|nr:hypothetical protein llg_28110 [Luteolibacter sp. LG18]